MFHDRLLVVKMKTNCLLNFTSFQMPKESILSWRFCLWISKKLYYTLKIRIYLKINNVKRLFLNPLKRSMSGGATLTQNSQLLKYIPEI